MDPLFTGAVHFPPEAETFCAVFVTRDLLTDEESRSAPICREPTRSPDRNHSRAGLSNCAEPPLDELKDEWCQSRVIHELCVASPEPGGRG